MRCYVLTALLLSVAAASPSARAATGDDTSATGTTAAKVNTVLEAHPAPYPHVHPRRVVRVVRPAPPPPSYNSRSSVYFGIGGLGNFFIEGNDELSKVYRGGGGLDLTLGLRLNSYLAFELGWLASFQSTESTGTDGAAVLTDGSVQSVFFDGKIFLMPSSERIEPFLQIGFGAYILSESLRAELTGFGFHLGGGVDIRLSDFIAVGLKVMYHGFYVDNSERSYYAIPTESAFLNTIMAEANLQFHF